MLPFKFNVLVAPAAAVAAVTAAEQVVQRAVFPHAVK